ncbi:MAG: DUF4339 domain-containing protein [Thermoguttaceae bacterium]
MSDDWYYMVGLEAVGPVSFDELRRAAAEGAVSADTLVRRTVTGEWLPAASIAGLFDAPAAPPPEAPRLMACHDCGHLVSSRAFACPKCGCPGPQVDISSRPALDGGPRRYLFLKLCGVAFAVVGGVSLFVGFLVLLSLMLGSSPHPADPRIGNSVISLAGGVVLLAVSQFCFLAIHIENNTARLVRLACERLPGKGGDAAD